MDGEIELPVIHPAGLTDQQILAAFLRKVAELVEEGKFGDVTRAAIRFEGKVSSLVVTYPVLADPDTIAMLERALLAMREPAP